MSGFDNFRAFFFNDSSLKYLLCYSFVVRLIRKRNNCDYVLLLMDHLIQCEGCYFLDGKIRDAIELLKGLVVNVSNDYKLSLFTTSLWYIASHTISKQGSYPY